ncbi:MAG: ferritin-like domain-containing protein [Acidobacteria bacterium]|nr:ferritin-like domain-containing protein [Acidobacteriota bacterium]
MDRKKVVKLLNQALTLELATYIRYSTQAAVLTGPYSVTIGDKLKQMAAEELRHADLLRDRLVALGERPTTEVADVDVGNKLKKMLEININVERKAVEIYKLLMRLVPKDESIVLYETVEDILCEEEKDLEDLDRLIE